MKSLPNRIVLATRNRGKVKEISDLVADLPVELLSAPLARALYPLPFWSLIQQEAGQAGIDPLLLSSLIREESRFDPTALSPASARGLTQFILPTALRVASEAGLPLSAAEDLYRPEIAIALGALHLKELHTLLPTPMSRIAAYNAGDHQAGLWLRHCGTTDPGEYFSKIGFSETRQYVARVLASHHAYLSLYSSGDGSDGD